MFFLIQGGCLKENLFCSIVLFLFQILGWFLLSTGLTPTGTQQICIALLQFEWNSCERPYLKVFFNIISCWNQNENVYYFQCHKLHFFPPPPFLDAIKPSCFLKAGKFCYMKNHAFFWIGHISPLDLNIETKKYLSNFSNNVPDITCKNPLMIFNAHVNFVHSSGDKSQHEWHALLCWSYLQLHPLGLKILRPDISSRGQDLVMQRAIDFTKNKQCAGISEFLLGHESTRAMETHSCQQTAITDQVQRLIFRHAGLFAFGTDMFHKTTKNDIIQIPKRCKNHFQVVSETFCA